VDVGSWPPKLGAAPETIRRDLRVLERNADHRTTAVRIRRGTQLGGQLPDVHSPVGAGRGEDRC